jgi:hypothetical protein
VALVGLLNSLLGMMLKPELSHDDVIIGQRLALCDTAWMRGLRDLMTLLRAEAREMKPTDLGGSC